jgi:hypothetical protein
MIMVVNAIALVFVTLLIFAGLWLVDMMAHSWTGSMHPVLRVEDARFITARNATSWNPTHCEPLIHGVTWTAGSLPIPRFVPCESYSDRNFRNSSVVGRRRMSKIRNGRALARARAAVDSAQAAEPSVKSRSPTSVGDWIVASVLIVKGEDFKIVNQPIEWNAVDLLIVELAP